MDRQKALEIFSRGFNRFCDRKGLTLEAAANMLGCGSGNISKIKAAKGLTSIDKVFTLIENGMTLYEIFGTELAEKLTAEMKEVLPDPKDETDAYNSPEFREGVAKAIAELVAKGHDAVNPLK